MRLFERFLSAAQPHEPGQHLAQGAVIHTRGEQPVDFAIGLALHCVEQGLLGFGIHSRLFQQRTTDAHMAEHQVDVLHARLPQHRAHQANHFDVAFDARVSVKLGADPDRRTGSPDAARQGVQHVVGVAQAHRAVAMQAMGVDAGGLGRDVRADAHELPAQLVDELERMQVEVMGRAHQQ